MALSVCDCQCKHMVYKLYCVWYSCHICTIASNKMEYKICMRWGKCVARDGAIGLADVSAIKHLQSMQLQASKALFLKLMRVVLKHVPLECWIQHMTGGFKTVSLAWVFKIAVIGCKWLFVYKSALTYEGRMNAALDHSSPTRYTFSTSISWSLQTNSSRIHKLCYCAENKICATSDALMIALMIDNSTMILSG